MTDAPDWVASKSAVERVMRATGQSAQKSLDAIIAYVKTGDIQARTMVLTEEIHRQGFSKQKNETRDVSVPLWFWDDFSARGWPSFNWQTDVFTCRGFQGSKHMTVTLTGVQFDARGLDILDPPTRQERIEPLPPNKVGRPTGTGLEDMIMDIFAKIHFGDLKPERQAHIEAAMHEWLSARNFAVSASTVRKRARKMWDALHREDEN